MGAREIRLADRAGWIAPSATLALVAKAKALIAEGKPVIRFDAGEPDFPTPEHVRDAAKRAMDEGKTGYTAASGMPEMKAAVAAAIERDSGLHYEPTEIVVGCGAKHTLFNAAQVLFQAGDEVLVPAPYWVSYPPMVEETGATAVIVPTTAEDGFLLTVEQLEAAITPRTRGLFINSPSNPTGGVYPDERLREIGELALEHDLWVLADEVYDKILYDGRTYTSFPALDPRFRDHTLLFNAVSKPYAMTGWRVGWCAGPAPVVKAMGTLQSQSTSNPCTISQWAAITALEGPQDLLAERAAAFARRRDHIVALVSALPDVDCRVPGGAFYVFPDFSAYLGRRLGDQVIATDTDLADLLIERCYTAVVPGSAFGAPGFLRFSYAISRADTTEGLRRIRELLEQLEPA